MSGTRPNWRPGLTLRPHHNEARCLLVSAALGKAWAIDLDQLLTVHRWFVGLSDRRPTLVDRLLEAGVVTDERTSRAPAALSATARLHTWSSQTPYLDLHDPHGVIRRQVVRGFSRRAGRDAAATGLLVAPGSKPLMLPAAHPVATIVGSATRRPRHVAARTQDSPDPIAYLVSYGAAFSTIIMASAVEGLDDGCYLADDIDPLKYTPLHVDQRALLASLDLEQSAEPSVVMFCVGDVARYRDRYRHEQAMRGFLIDGGRIFREMVLELTELRISPLLSASFPLSAAVSEVLGLREKRHLLFGVIYAGVSANQWPYHPAH